MNRITNSRGEVGARQRQKDVPEELERPGAVDPRRLGELVRHGHEELAEQERRGGRGDQRHDQAGIGVEHAEIRDDLEGRHDPHLHRQHQREEDGPEAEHAEREAEVDDRERREDRDRDLAERDAERHDQRVEHHGRDRLGARGLDAAAEHRGVVLVQAIARPERHRRLEDHLRRVARGDEGDPDRERHQQHPADQDEVREGGHQRASFDHRPGAGCRQVDATLGMPPRHAKPLPRRECADRRSRVR
jgi:hypothetical protein